MTVPSIIVVGAGPAGATAARALALAGVTVRLLDRSKFPRNKPCGGGITLRVLRRFPYLEAELGRIATHRLSRLYLEGPIGESATIESGDPAVLMIRRVEFDALLVDLAVRAGAELVTDAEVVRATAGESHVALEARDGRRFEAPFVIAADGVNSVVARRVGLNHGWPARSVALDMMEETPRERLREVDPATLWVAYGYAPRTNRNLSPDGPAPEGYAYIFPKRDHVNVGIGYLLDYYRRAVDIPPYTLQEQLVGDLAERGVIEGTSVRGHFTPYLIPVGGPLKRLGHGRVLLAGDAGGFVNGMTAEGIYYAMVSGALAARTVQNTGRDVSGMARRYEQACHREVGAELRDSVLIQRYLFADRRRIARVVAAAAGSRLTGRLLDLAKGRLSYRQLRREMFRLVPAFSARLAWSRALSLVWPERRSTAAGATGV